MFLYQVYTNLAYAPPTYRRVKKLQVLMINKDVRKYLACKNGDEILICSWNNPGARTSGGRRSNNDPLTELSLFGGKSFRSVVV